MVNDCFRFNYLANTGQGRQVFNKLNSYKMNYLHNGRGNNS